MELRRRNGNGEATDAANAKNAAAMNAEDLTDGQHQRQHPSVTHDNIGAAEPLRSENSADAVVGAAVRGGSLLMLLALIQRASTFVLNVLLQRAMLSSSPDSTPSDSDATNPPSSSSSSALEAYGAAAITLELISSTALFLAREPFRVALARSRVPTATDDVAVAASRRGGDGATPGSNVVEGGRAGWWRREAYRRRFVNTAWISAPVGLAFAALVRLTYPWVIRNDAFDGVEENRQAASLVCLAAAVELMCEPLALIFQYRLLIDVRVRAESAAVLVLGASRYLLVTRAGLGVLSFGYAQLLHSVTLAAAYMFFAAKDVTKAKEVAAAAIVGQPPQQQQPSARSQTGEPPGSVNTPPSEVLAAIEGDQQGFARVRGWFPCRPTRNASGAGTGAGADEGWVDRGKIKLAGELAGQSLLKHVLTEGDKIVLARAISQEGGHGSVGSNQGGSLYEQGVYAIASGYGSLAARLLFQPLEEAARLMFSKLGAEEGGVHQDERPPPKTGASSARDVAQPSLEIEGSVRGPQGGNGGAGDDGRRLLRERMAALLATLLKLVLTAGLVFVCFGFHYTETLLRLLLAGKGGGGSGGSRAVSEVARVLSWYCVYVLFLAANGMCEAFACAVARGGQLTGMGAGLVASFATFWALVGPLTSRFGTRGLVMANAAGMACRVICSAVFIRRFFLQGKAASTTTTTAAADNDATAVAPPSPSNEGEKRRRKQKNERNLWREVVSGALPHPGVVAAMAMSSAAAFATSPVAPLDGEGANGAGDVSWNVTGAATHVAVGLVCFVATAAVFAKCEGTFLKEVRALWAVRRRRQPSGEGGGGGAVDCKRDKTD